ncbi:hypothetical protein D3C87_781830 [compost metagenome]
MWSYISSISEGSLSDETLSEHRNIHEISGSMNYIKELISISTRHHSIGLEKFGNLKVTIKTRIIEDIINEDFGIWIETIQTIIRKRYLILNGSNTNRITSLDNIMKHFEKIRRCRDKVISITCFTILSYTTFDINENVIIDLGWIWYYTLIEELKSILNINISILESNIIVDALSESIRKFISTWNLYQKLNS